MFLVSYANGNDTIVDVDLLPFYGIDFIKCNDIGFMHSHKAVGRQNLFQLFHYLQRNDPLIFGIDGDIIF